MNDRNVYNLWKEAKMKTIGLITIGQSPRTDVTEDIGAFFSEEVTVLEAGALDHITEAELQDMRPEGNETALVSRMRDGRQVIFAEKHILRLLQQCVAELQDKGSRCHSLSLHRKVPFI